MLAIDISLETFLKTLETGSGFWNPLVWITAAVVAFLIMFILRGFGNKGFKQKTGQTKPFLSGNEETSKENMHVPAANLYWGFTESLKWFYKYFRRMHNGNVSDYILWFVIIMAIMFIMIGVI